MFPLQEGERIELLSKVNDEWLRGRVRGAEGIFPAGFARVIVPLETWPAAAGSDAYRAVALYPFHAETEHDLGVQVPN